MREWHLENSRTARWNRANNAVEIIVIDPTIVMSLCCFSQFKKGFENAAGDAKLAAPGRIGQDLFLMTSRLYAAGKLTVQEAEWVMDFLDGIPLQKVHPSRSLMLRLTTEHQLSHQFAAYLASAWKQPDVLMTFDPNLLRASRTLRIPRFRFSALHRLNVMTMPPAGHH